MQLYIKLGEQSMINMVSLLVKYAGGSGKTMPKGLKQARRMLNMRIKDDVWSRGLDENFRESIRENVRELFCQLPVRRVW